MIRLNLGCGRDVLEGWWNVDVHDGPGVDTIVDLDGEGSLRGLVPTGVASRVKALGLLEHLPHWENCLLECARVLRPREGFLEVRVPYRFADGALTPYHVRFFDERTFDPFRSDALYRQYDLRRRPHTFSSLEFQEPYFTLWSSWVEHWYPFAWHLARRIGDRAYRLPLGPARNLHVLLRRNGRGWAD